MRFGSLVDLILALFIYRDAMHKYIDTYRKNKLKINELKFLIL